VIKVLDKRKSKNFSRTFQRFSGTSSRPIPTIFYHITLDVSAWHHMKKLSQCSHDDFKHLEFKDFQEPLTIKFQNSEDPVWFSRTLQGLK